MSARPQSRWLLGFALLFFAGITSTRTPPPAFAQDPPASVSPARDQILHLIQQAHADVSVAFRSLDGTQELFIKSHDEFPAAPSVIQIPIMMELYAQSDEGELRLSDTVTVHNGFRSLADGSPFQLDPKTDPDQDLYQQIGKPVTLRDLCEHMVAHNSSLAADLLIEKLGIDGIRQRIDALHITGMQVVRDVEPAKPNDKSPGNITSARAVLDLLYELAKRQDSGDDSAEEMVGMVARAALSQPPTAGMPSDPRNTQVAQLAGTGQQAMIIYGPHPFVVAILVRGLPSPAASAALMAQIENALAAGLAASIGGGG